jgi:hypothetical protein
VFAAAAAWVTWVAWPGSADNPATSVARLDVVTLLPLLAGLPLLARRFLGPPVGPLARVLRSGGYAVVLVLTVAKASVEQVADNPAAIPRLPPEAPVPSGIGMMYVWLVESLLLLAMAVYVAAVLALTSCRSRVAPVTLAIGTGAGLVLGAVMYAVAPLGLGKTATNPWLAGAAIDPVVVLAWVLLFGAPVLAGVIAARCYRGPDSPEQVYSARIKQAVAAGFLATAVGALMVTVLGAVTIALMPRRAGYCTGCIRVRTCSRPSPTTMS